MLALALVATGCSSDDDNEAATDTTEEGADTAGDDSGADTEDLEVDDCTLLTDDEVSRLADEPLFVSEGGESFLGCGWSFEDEAIDSFGIRSFREDTTVAEHAEELAPNNEVIEIEGVGDEAVGLMSEGEVNFLVARDGDLFVELVMTFLDVPPDSANFETAKELARTALERLKDAA